MITAPIPPRTYPLEVYQMAEGLRRRRRERASPTPQSTPWRVPHSRLPQTLRDELDAIARLMHAADPMPIPINDKESPMHLQLVNDPEPTDVTTPEPEASVQGGFAPSTPKSRAEWRKLVEAKCSERGITMSQACRETGLSTGFFAPSQQTGNVYARNAKAIQQWLDTEPTAAPIQRDKRLRADVPLPVEAPSPVEEPLPAPPIRLEYSYTGPVPFLPPTPARPARRYPPITVEPSAMPLDDLIEYPERLRDLMPGATVTWPAAIAISQE